MVSKLTPKIKKFYAYCRESIDLESGIKIQKETINNYTKLNNIEIVKWFIDNDSSAYEYRPHYNKMMKLIFESDNDCDGIICSALSRFGRSTNSVLEAKSNLTINNKELVLIKEHLDTTTPQGRLQFGIFVLFNDFEHDLIIERTQSGIKYAMKNGTKSGKPMHRPPKVVDWKKFDEYIEKKISIPSIAKMFGMTKKTLYEKIKRRDNHGCQR